MLPSTTGHFFTLSAIMSLRLVVLLHFLIAGNRQICSGYETEGSFPLVGGSANNDSAYVRFVILHLPPVLIVTRNSSNHVTNLQGIAVSILKWLSVTMNFKYEIIPDNIYSVENNAAGKGLMSYILEGHADVILGGVVIKDSRFQKLNFPYPFVIGQFGLVIPKPSTEVDVTAVWKPFQRQIWIFLVVSMGTTILCLYSISHCIKGYMTNEETKTKFINGKLFEDIGRAFQYVFGVILSQGLLAQGGTSRDQKLTIRFLAGAWCTACFVLVTAYSSVLISFVTSPNYKPLIQSLYDIPKNPNIKVTVNRGWSPDLLFTNAEDGIFKYLGDQLRNEPELRCSETEQCMERVRKGPSAYIQEYRTIQNSIGLDLKQNGRCDFTIAKELFFSFGAGLAISKRANIEHYSRGILKAHEAGLVDLWFRRNTADASRCLNRIRDVTSEKQRVTLAGLSGAFLALALGFGISALSFFVELNFQRG